MLIEGSGTEKATLYGGLAESISNLIETGTFREGERIPSIRAMSRQFGVSVNTVREAYWLLETQSLIEGRPQSGYFVRSRPTSVALSKAGSRLFDLPYFDPHEVLPCSLREEGNGFLENLAHQGLDLARGSVSSSLLPSQKLNSFLGAVSREAGPATVDYDTLKGVPELREAVARLSLDAGVRLAPDDFLITAGCLHAVTLAVQVLCRPGDTVAVETPTYSEFLKLFKRMDIRVLEIPTGRDGMSLEVLEWALDKYEVQAVLSVPTFNNPAAFLMPEHRKKELVELLTRKSVPLIEDDAYGSLSFLEKRPLACKAFDTEGIVIYCSSVSKTLAPGYRVGWVAGGRWHEELTNWKVLTSAGASQPTQLAVARYLREGNFARHLRTLGRTLAAQSGAMIDAVVRSFPPGTSLARPVGGLFLWIELPDCVDTEALYAVTVEDGVFFRPGVVFSASGKLSRHLRICTGSWNSKIEKAVLRLGELACKLSESKMEQGKVS